MTAFADQIGRALRKHQDSCSRCRLYAFHSMHLAAALEAELAEERRRWTSRWFPEGQS